MAGSNDIESAILERLDILVKLLGHQIASTYETLEEKAVALNAIGLPPADIAKICGTTSGTVSVRLAEAKKKGKRKTKRKKARA
jgi:DNA-directed RNA polymerase specialized sigma24 family protein